MKSDFGKKIVVAIHWLMSLGLGIAMTVLFFMDKLPVKAQRADAIVFAIAMLIVYLIFAAGALLISFPELWRWKERNFVTISAGGLGRTRISVPAVDQMIRKAMRDIDGVADMKTQIVNGEDSVEINVNIMLAAGAHVPTVTSNAQRAVRSYIEKNCGIEVSAVIVSVFSVQDDEAPVEAKKKIRLPFVSQSAPATEAAPTPVADAEPEAEAPAATVFPSFDVEDEATAEDDEASFAMPEEEAESPDEPAAAEEVAEAPTQGLSRSAKKRRRRKKKLAKLNAQNAVESNAAAEAEEESVEAVEEDADEFEAAEAVEEIVEEFSEPEAPVEEAEDSIAEPEVPVEEVEDSFAEPEAPVEEAVDSFAEEEEPAEEAVDSFAEYEEPVEPEADYVPEETFEEEYPVEDEETQKYDDYLTD